VNVGEARAGAASTFAAAIALRCVDVMPSTLDQGIAVPLSGRALFRCRKGWRAARLTAALTVAGALAACSTTSDFSMTPLVDPGKYQFNNCEQIEKAVKTQTTRRNELKGLMEKAEQSGAGVVVGALAYRADYVSTGQELQVLEATARDKNCPRPADWGSSSAIR
jgi:hypothetical protein